MPDNVLIASDITVELGSAYVGSAYSPRASVTQTDTGWELTITYADPDTPGELATLTIPVDSAGFGEVTASVESGHGTPQVVVTESGPDTAKSFHFAFSGIGGFSPTITVTEIEGGHRVTVTDVDGTESFDVLDGDPSQAIEDAERAAALANAAAATADASAAAADTATAEAQAATTAAQGATSATQTATSAANTATGRANTAATSATSAASAAQTATTAAQAATTAADTAADNAQDAADRANAAAAGITDAYSPMFTAGASEGVTGGGPSDTAAWVERTCPGTDGPAKVESIHGRTLVWNQMRGPADGTNSGTISRVTYAKNADGSVSVGGTATARVNIYLHVFAAGDLIVGHKYLVKGCCPAGGSASTYFGGIGGSAHDTGNGGIWTNESTTTVTQLSIVVVNGATIPQTTLWPMFIDLTRMFGAGNEPSTVAEFERMFPEPYYPYDAGSLLSVNMTGIETEDADGNALMTRTIPAATYFPNGMRSAGTVYDELTATSAITRVGSVTLDGSETWTKSARYPGGYFLSEWVARNSVISTTDHVQDVLTTAASASEYVEWSCLFDRSLNVRVPETVAPTRADFVAWLAEHPITIHYALAIPTATPIDPPLNLTYKAAAGGTEHVTHTEQTAPPTLVVAYGYTAESLLAAAASTLADPDGPTATTNHAVGSYLTMGGTLYRVTTAIAAGESITPGTNVTATTVMAEVVSLIQ